MKYNTESEYAEYKRQEVAAKVERIVNAVTNKPDVHGGCSVTPSRGNGRGGTRYAYVRPAKECINRSRRVSVDRVQMCILKHFTPCLYFRINGAVVGSNSPENALKEYWKRCELKDIGKQFEVTQITDEI